MKIFLDTNVLVSAVVKQRVFHERSFAVFESVLNRKNDGFVSSHSRAKLLQNQRLLRSSPSRDERELVCNKSLELIVSATGSGR
jgi:predicted nucleic acid-binding protein